MKKTTFFVFLILVACAPSNLHEVFDQYLWKNRVLLVFSPDIKNPQYHSQNAILFKNIKGLNERDIVIWNIVNYHHVKVNNILKPQLPANRLFEHFNVSSSNLTVILIGKDGTEKLRSSNIVSQTSLFDLIDAMPLRKNKTQNKDSHHTQ